MIEQKGMTFDYDIFAINSSILLPSFLGTKKKEEENNQSHGQESCLSARSFVIDAYPKEIQTI